MTATVTFKTYDTFPFDQTLTADGTAIDLTDADVELNMVKSGKRIEGTCTLIDAAAGQVRYEWAPGDLDTPGTYKAEWEITYSDGVVETVPNDGYTRVVVYADLDEH